MALQLQSAEPAPPSGPASTLNEADVQSLWEAYGVSLGVGPNSSWALVAMGACPPVPQWVHTPM